jgi:hypothetical protein
MIKPGRGRWEKHLAFLGDRGDSTRFWWGNLRERGHLEDLGLDGRIILNGPLINRMGVDWIDLARYTDKV